MIRPRRGSCARITLLNLSQPVKAAANPRKPVPRPEADFSEGAGELRRRRRTKSELKKTGTAIADARDSRRASEPTSDHCGMAPTLELFCKHVGTQPVIGELAVRIQLLLEADEVPVPFVLGRNRRLGASEDLAPVRAGVKR